MIELQDAPSEQAFYNQWVDIDTIPRATNTVFIKLEREYLYVRLMNVFIITITGGLALVFFIFLSSMSWPVKFIFLGGFIFLMIAWAVLVYFEFKYRGYAVRDHNITYKSGLIFRQSQYLPFRRVQHCKITEGPVERLFNFATVIVSAAGDDIVIHGLRPEDAQALQQFINDKVDALTKEMHYGRN